MMTQIIYPKEEGENIIATLFKEEAEYMKDKGFVTGYTINFNINRSLYRGNIRGALNLYQNKNISLINSSDSFIKTLNMSSFLPVIYPWTFKSVIIPFMDENEIIGIQNKLNSKKLFIKNNFSSLIPLGKDASTYPDTSIKEMKKNFDRLGLSGPYIVREFIEDKEIFFNEKRIWVLNGKPYSHSGCPDFVFDAAQKIYEFSKSKYFTIDVAGDYIVEVNPGESSDRGGDNPLEWFCDIFAKEFLLQ